MRVLASLLLLMGSTLALAVDYDAGQAEAAGIAAVYQEADRALSQESLAIPAYPWWGDVLNEAARSAATAAASTRSGRRASVPDARLPDLLAQAQHDRSVAEAEARTARTAFLQVARTTPDPQDRAVRRRLSEWRQALDRLGRARGREQALAAAFAAASGSTSGSGSASAPAPAASP
jgi:hypothetical protein